MPRFPSPPFASVCVYKKEMGAGRVRKFHTAISHCRVPHSTWAIFSHCDKAVRVKEWMRGRLFAFYTDSVAEFAREPAAR